MNLMLDAALIYASNAWPILPLHSPTSPGCSCLKSGCEQAGKHPRTQNGLKNATTDESIIRQWWTRWPEANVGVRTGAISGLVVLDVDPRHGGDESLIVLEQENGRLPVTRQQTTGGGGRHLLFVHPGMPLKNKVAVLPGLDVRGDGGYIVAPPSRHVSGCIYQWETDEPIAAAPSWLLALFTRRNSDKALGLASTASNVIPIGTRDSTLASLAGTMRRRGMSQEAIEAALHLENTRRCQQPLAEAEVTKIATSISQYAPGQEFNSTDVGNADRFIRDHGHRLRYVHSWNRWLVWTGTHWARDETAEVVRLARVTVAKMYADAAGVTEQKSRELLARHALASESERRLRAMISLAQADAQVAITHQALDINPWMLNVRNGTLDLRTQQLQAHRREDLITHFLDLAFDPDAKFPNWVEFLLRILNGDEGLFSFLQRAVGYTLTRSTSEQVFFLCYGTGANGKSTFLEVLRALLGGLAQHADFSTFLTKKNTSIPNDIARLRGARMVTAVEAEGERRLCEAVVKQLTGGDTVTARFLHAEFFEFRPAFKLWFATNHRPIIRGTDHAIWRRVRLIPFDVTIPKQEQDPDLVEKLREELPGILAWAVTGCRAWLRDGLGEAAAVEVATAQYREEMDTLGAFLEECCVLGHDKKAKPSELMQAYRKWADLNGGPNVSQKALAAYLRERPEGLVPEKVGGVRWWVGIGLTEHEG